MTVSKLIAELKPCPFCGGEATTIYIRDGRVAVCKSCGTSGERCHHGPIDIPSAEERAKSSWNTRVPAPSHEAMRVALERIEKEDRLWVYRSDSNNDTVVVTDDDEHHSILVLGKCGKIARTALSTLTEEV